MIRQTALIALAAASAACSTVGDPAALSDDVLQASNVAIDAARRAPGRAMNAVQAAQAALGPPRLAPVGSPEGLVGDNGAPMPQPESISFVQPSPNSLWRAGERSFFDDQRATRVGDILTVDIEITDKAEVTNSSNRSREASTAVGIDNFFGLETQMGNLFGGAFDPSTLIGADAQSDQTGQGAINREEKIELAVAAVIVERLANGNFIIAGRQQVRINGELRELTVSGMIRPQDISAENKIRHDQIAEARISYGGRGTISAVQRPNVGQRIGDAISPW